MNGLRTNFERAGAGKQVARWKKQMDMATRRAVKASRRAIHVMNNSGSPAKAVRMAVKAKRQVIKAANGL